MFPDLRREALGAEVQIDFLRRAYGGRRCPDPLSTQPAAVWNEETRTYRVDLANFPVDGRGREGVAAPYGCR